jgi:hypothetical protein
MGTASVFAPAWAFAKGAGSSTCPVIVGWAKASAVPINRVWVVRGWRLCLSDDYRLRQRSNTPATASSGLQPARVGSVIWPSPKYQSPFIRSNERAGAAALKSTKGCHCWPSDVVQTWLRHV